MAISVQPVDGLISRLLQQNSKTAAAKAPPQSNQHGAMARDSVSISSQAQSEAYVQANIHQHKAGEKALESHLLNLYKSHDHYGG